MKYGVVELGVGDIREEHSSWICISRSIKFTTVKLSGCRVKNSLTTLSDGIYTLEELLQDHNINETWNDVTNKNLEVIQENNKTFKVLSTYRNGKSKTKKIIMNYGLEVESTPNHQWFVKEFINNTFYKKPVNKWIRADQLTPGHVLDVQMNNYNNNKPYKFKHIDIIDENLTYNTNRITQPKEMNNDIAWLLGFFYGDGNLDRNSFRFYDEDKHFYNFDKIKRVLTDNFGFTEDHFKNGSDSKSKKCKVLSINSVLLRKFFEENDINKYSIDEGLSNIPLCIRTSSKENIISFISGLIDSDGSIRRSKDCFRITITSAYEELCKNLQHIAFSVGLCLSKNKYKQPLMSFSKGGFIYYMSLRQHTSEDSLNILIENSNKLKNQLEENPDTIWKCLKKSVRNGILGKIKEIKDNDEEVETFDIEVENEHWYYNGTVKSYNTVSLLPGVSPGVHYPHSKYYKRRIRIPESSPLKEYNEMKSKMKEIDLSDIKIEEPSEVNTSGCTNDTCEIIDTKKLADENNENT